ncbi:hypothetical protein BU16DRAFT_125532 [Lophium mytilinum]|uniref:Rap-GAP domain-containing protein n=1 Tax=Lophium mytilinum TaxID=390894 RepID=A0A6A6QGZ3_9PEZI|nr:hypothetical protein BU16DRAFT_125532 [Lophium mytilinum]
MSPSSSNVPQTPDRQSSTNALLGAFRTLTGGRIKNPSSPSTSATLTPAQTPSLRSVDRAASAASAPPGRGIFGVGDGLSQCSESCHEADKEKDVAGEVLGGPVELASLLEQLDIANPTYDRILAIKKICPILKDYPVDNVSALWIAASDLLDQEDPPEASEAAYSLLTSCVELPDLSPMERHIFFKAISSGRSPKNCDLRLQAMLELTIGGRNVEAFEPLVAPFVTKSLDTCFKLAREARRTRKQKRAGPTLKEDETLSRMFQYIVDITKFNSKVFKEEDVDLLLTQTMAICKETTQESDIDQAIRIFDTLITYTHIPVQSLKPCLEVLCDVHRQLTNLQDPTWSSLSNLFKSHVGQASVTALLGILRDAPNPLGRRRNIPRGVVHVLQKLLLYNGADSLPKVPVSLLLSSLKVSLAVNYPKHDADVVGLIATIVTDTTLTQLLLKETDWSDLVSIVDTCAHREEMEPGSASSSTIEATSNVDPSLGSGTQSAEESKAYDDLSRILTRLDSLCEQTDFVQKASIMELFMRLAHRISNPAAEGLVRYYAEERLLHPSNETWLEACRTLLAKAFKDQKRPRPLRLLIVQTLRDTYNTVEGICTGVQISQCAQMILDNIADEKDVAVLHELVDFAVNVADRASDEVFEDVVALLKAPLEQPAPQSPNSHPNLAAYWASPAIRRDVETFGTPHNVLASALVRLFTRTLNQSAMKCRVLYDTLLLVAGSESCDTDARITALKLLFRLRSDSNYAMIVNPSSEGESIAAVLCRTTETAIHQDKIDDHVPIDTSKPEEHISWRDKKDLNNSPHSSLTRNSARPANLTGRISRPVPPLWMYPGPKGLPEEPSRTASRYTFSYVEPTDEQETSPRSELKIALWLELLISLLQKAPDWELYSYILVHLGPQLSNQSLFRNAVPQLKMLRSVLCEQIRATTFHEPPNHTLLKKADVAVCLFHVLTILISYHAHYEKSEEDELVRAFLHGIGSWERTSKWCIHALTVCCHELPLSVTKSLDNIVVKMSQIITQAQVAIHILEFLTSLARMPELHKHFREDDYRTIFGVSFRYLQYVRHKNEDMVASSSSPSGQKALRHSGASRDFSHASNPKAVTNKSTTDDLPQYVYALAFHVITFWFMALKLPERHQQIKWITQNLVYQNKAGHNIIEEQSQVIIDLMQMVAYSDRDETSPNPDFAKPSDGDILEKTWLVGHSLLTLETAGRTGVTQMTSRRPCGTRYSSIRPLVTQLPQHHIPIASGETSEAFLESSYPSILPDDIYQSYFGPLNFPSALGVLPEPPTCLPEDDMSRRAIATFDRSPTVDGHKIGVIYIGEGQTDEREILLNVMGSSDYTAFLGDLGTLMRLKGAKFNTGGLDTRYDSDGEFTIAWRDRVMEICYHITTMMPTNLEGNETYANKKRHIGNDFVNIIFNDSGLPYDFDTFPSAFNYVHIVVTPEARASFIERRLDLDPDGRTRYYKVQVIPKPGFPEISPAAESKMISGKHLAAYCRLIAINASVFSQVWFEREGGESVSSWRHRLRQIVRLRERYIPKPVPPKNDDSPSSPSGEMNRFSSTPVPSSRGSNMSMRESKITVKRSSNFTHVSEGTSRSSIASGAAEMERQGSGT